MPSSDTSRGQIVEIDGLRGIAILAVMVHRLWPRDAVNRFSVAADAGWIGVDLFFVVSGFLITRILLETRDDPGYFRNFYARRILRIFPLYYLFVGTLLVAFPLAGNREYLDHSGSPFWYLTFLGNVPEALLGKDPPYWLAPVWSLAIEEQFYLTFPWLVYWLGPHRLARLLLALMLLAPALRAATMFGAPEHERVQYLFTLCRVDAIAAGCMIALVLRWRHAVSLHGIALTVACCAGAVAVISDLDRTTPFGRIAGYSFVAIGFGALLLAVLTKPRAWWVAPLRLPPLCYLGKLCFGLYLLHRPADTITTAIANRFDVNADRISWIPIKIAVAVVFASISWFAFERPIARLKRHFESRRHPSVRASSVVTVAIVLLAAGCDGTVAPAVTQDGGAGDGRERDARSESDDAGGDADVPVPASTVLYPFDRTHSPITAELAAHLRDVASRDPTLDERVFAKVGDSITTAPEFVTCFDGAVALGEHAALAPVVEHFRTGRIAGATPYARASEAAHGGWTGADLLAGEPCAVDREAAIARPRFAVMLFGTNDNRYGRTLDEFGRDLWTIADSLLARGIVPILSTLPPLASYPEADVRVPLFNLVVRAIAQGRGVPLVDLHRELVALPARGLSGDGIHPSVSPDGACRLDAMGLAYGYNARNLITLVALGRTRDALASRPPDGAAPMRTGDGTLQSPYASTLPLVDLGDTRAGHAVVESYPGCPQALALGREVVYELELAATTTLDAYVIDHAGTNAVVYLLARSGCVAYGANTATAQLPAGKVGIVVDTPSASGEGEYLLVVTAR